MCYRTTSRQFSIDTFLFFHSRHISSWNLGVNIQIQNRRYGRYVSYKYRRATRHVDNNNKFYDFTDVMQMSAHGMRVGLLFCVKHIESRFNLVECTGSISDNPRRTSTNFKVLRKREIQYKISETYLDDDRGT